jgi:hypothetical protein
MGSMRKRLLKNIKSQRILWNKCLSICQNFNLFNSKRSSEIKGLNFVVGKEIKMDVDVYFERK